jgi:hypothetical protein
MKMKFWEKVMGLQLDPSILEHLRAGMNVAPLLCRLTVFLGVHCSVSWRKQTAPILLVQATAYKSSPIARSENEDK